MSFYVAGHHFNTTPNGIRCTGVRADGSPCDAAWRHIRTATEADINEPGWAHNGRLSVNELAQIVIEREAERVRIWAAVTATCAAGSSADG